MQLGERRGRGREGGGGGGVKGVAGGGGGCEEVVGGLRGRSLLNVLAGSATNVAIIVKF